MNTINLGNSSQGRNDPGFLVFWGLKGKSGLETFLSPSPIYNPADKERGKKRNGILYPFPIAKVNPIVKKGAEAPLLPAYTVKFPGDYSS